MKRNPFQAYIDKFSESKFWQKLSRYARQAGIQATYAALLLFYAYNRKETPGWAKRIVLGTLGYLISPIDVMPDLTPLVGYTDDLGVLTFGLVTIAAYIDGRTKEKARQKLKDWFGNYDESSLQEIDRQL